ncbi:MAG TPA: ribonuclease P protein component [Flavisolibacter sp.]|nr:ribonuclease P protein component [Flavisolibacter sp.]
MRQFTYHRKEKLKKRSDIDLLFKEGRTFGAFPFRVYYRLLPVAAATSNEIMLQAGVSVSKKHFKRAVHRNRIKRLMREGYRLQKEGLILALRTQGCIMHLFIIYTGKELPVFEDVKNKLKTILQRLEKEIATP